MAHSLLSQPHSSFAPPIRIHSPILSLQIKSQFTHKNPPKTLKNHTKTLKFATKTLKNHPKITAQFHNTPKSPKKTLKFPSKTLKNPNKNLTESPISPNIMPFTNLKATLGQRFNLEGIILAAGILAGDRNLLLPHIAVPDLRWIDWPELRRRGFKGVVFDKDNTITLPYQLALWGPLISEIENCKCVFGDENVVVLSNSAGLYEFDPDGAKASEVERKIGIKVVRHRVKKPAGTTAEIEKQLGCVAVELVVVGDRRFTDVVYGNRNGCLTVLTEPLTSDGEPFVVRRIRRVEEILVERWYKQGLRPLRHNMLGDEDPQMIFVKDFPPLE